AVTSIHFDGCLSQVGETGMKRPAAHSTSALAALFLAVSVGVGGLSAPAAGQAPDMPTQPLAKYLARSEAVREALQNNPVLRTVRQQRGYAEAGVVLARTYPFNPSFTSITAHNSGPESAGITNRTFLEDYVTLEIELLHQGRYRRAAASAAATRIEWEI